MGSGAHAACSALDMVLRRARRSFLQGCPVKSTPRAVGGVSMAAAQTLIGRKFRKVALLREALTHSSAGDPKLSEQNNERLEFLGDRVLGLVIAERLNRDYPAEGESALAPRLNALVNKAACARAARR